MLDHRLLCLAALVAPVWGQRAFQSAGGDMTSIAPLMAGLKYRGLTHAMGLMSGVPWIPDAELARRTG